MAATLESCDTDDSHGYKIHSKDYFPWQVRNVQFQLAEWKGSKEAKPMDVHDLAAHAEGLRVTRRDRFEDRIKNQ